MDTLPLPRALGALAAALMLLAGCSSPAGTDTAASRPALPSVGEVYPGDAADASGAEEGSGGAPVGAGDERAQRQVARSASVTVATPDAAAAAQRVRDIAAHRSGWIASEYLGMQQDGTRPSEAHLTLSVPADALDATLDDLATVGTLLNRSILAADVTDMVVDVDARIRSLEASIARVEALMERAGTVAEIATVEKELASRQSELEVLRSQQAYYASITQRASVDVALTAPATASANPLWAGLLGGWDALGASARLLLVVVGALLPFAVVALLIAAPVVWFVRRRRTRRDAAAAATAPGEAEASGETSGASSVTQG
ncbi:DUF4349 domain-containing protein [Propioniciclava soli]|uniref:DUF4349 domain-containing protein n=1 Tax=Propioniciclava soli TaxID=2775081 RepID=A0ABZ3C6X2_9ACTN